MKKILYKLSLRYHYPMRSDNLNNVMKLNRFLANPLIIALKIILMDVGIFFLLNFIINQNIVFDYLFISSHKPV